MYRSLIFAMPWAQPVGQTDDKHYGQEFGHLMARIHELAGYIESRWQIPDNRFLLYRLRDDDIGLAELRPGEMKAIIAIYITDGGIMTLPTQGPSCIMGLVHEVSGGVSFVWPGHRETADDDVSEPASWLATALNLQLKIV